MTITDRYEIIDNKIKANQAQYDLDRVAAEKSAYSYSNLRKYEYLTSEKFGYKSRVVEQAKYSYSPLGKVFNKGLTGEEWKEGILKSVENIGGRTEKLLKAIKDQRIKQSDSKKTEIKSDLTFYSNHNFYKYRLSKFSQIPSIEYKFDTLEMFCRDFTSSKFLKAKKERVNHKSTVLRNGWNLYNNELTLEYKKAYERKLKDNKSYGW